ncbi:MAG: glutathione S-transferase family protein [Cyanobacteria bacterium]|jgi:glutathione S-transferase|nr:glutathione S-transferase family protein [Cyanobacteria bacterium GSL.Bin1]
MLTFYYHPLSPVARRVWLALLEKQIPFHPVLVDLRGEQNQPEFLALNPFHHVPVIVENNLRLIESLAILDYLEKRYPEITLSPHSAPEFAKMRMVQMVTTNEVMPKLPLVANAEVQPLTTEQETDLNTGLGFLEAQLAQNNYFGGDTLNLADIVVGATVPLLFRLGIAADPYPRLQAWQEKLSTREAWQQTEPNAEDFAQWKRYIQITIKRYQRQKQSR